MSCGIYEILHRQTSYRYIGMSGDFDERWRAHQRMLQAGRHHCVLLQRAWDRYGADAFIFQIVEEISVPVTQEYLRHREKAWRERYDPALFNPLKAPKGVDRSAAKRKRPRKERRQLAGRRRGDPKFSDAVACPTCAGDRIEVAHATDANHPRQERPRVHSVNQYRDSCPCRCVCCGWRGTLRRARATAVELASLCPC